MDPAPAALTTRAPSAEQTTACSSSAVAAHDRQGAERQLAAAAEGGDDGAFGIEGGGRRQVVHPLHRPPGPVVAGANLERDDALSGRRHAGLRRQRHGDAIAEAEAFQPRRGEHEEVVVAAIELPQPRVHVAPDARERRAVHERAELGDPPDAAGADARGRAERRQQFRQRPRRGAVRQHERVAGIRPRQRGRHGEAVRQHRRHVLGAVYRDVDLVAQQRVLQLLDEEALAADLRQRRLLQAIAGGADDHEIDVEIPRFELGGDGAGLPQRQLAAARADPEGHVHQSRLSGVTFVRFAAGASACSSAASRNRRVSASE